MAESPFPKDNQTTFKSEVEDSAINVDLLADLEELDEREFDLPPVSNPPTLESILNESDDSGSEGGSEHLNHASGTFQEAQAESNSLSSWDSLERKAERKVVTHGSVLRHVILRGVSSQLQSAADRFGAGKPTVMAVSLVIAVGSSHGLVLVFDPEQALKWCLGSTENGEEYGAVSALDISLQCTRLLVGYARGHITLWNLSNGALLQTILDAHPPQCPVLHLRFMEDHHIAVCSDGGGSVFELTFTRKRGSRTCNCRCIFSGSRGEVFTVEPLHIPPNFKKQGNADQCIVALATVTKVIVVSLRPFLKVHFSHPLVGDPHTLPLLCWQFVIIQMSPSMRIIDPVLTFCRQQVVNFFQANFTANRVKFASLKKIELPYIAQNMKWLNSRTLAIFDSNERLHVIDIRSHEEQEVLDLSDVELVYGTSHFKGLATGGNVSRAMTAAGERACFHSMVGFGPQLLFLGIKSVHVITLRTWNERIDYLTKQNCYQEALELALSFYQDKAKAVVGLVGKKAQRQQQVAEKIAELIHKYVDLSMTQLCPDRGRIEDLMDHYREVVPLCVKYSLLIGRKDLLYGKIWETYSADAISHTIFLESLEPHVLDHKLSDLPPIIAKDFVTYYVEKKRFLALESCIVHLEIACLDIHQVMTVCREHGLYDAIIYIYNQGLGDFISPLEELLEVLGKAVNSGKQLTDEHIRLGNKLLVYISFSLAGKAYPTGDIEPQRVSRVKKEVFKCVTRLRSENSDTIYPYLKILLHFDTREFLNVLSLAFEEPEFNDPSEVDQKQRIVDILLPIMVNCGDFSPSQVGALFTFLARQLARPDNTVIVDRMLFKQVLEYLTVAAEETRIEERQQAMLELLQAGGLEQVDEDQLLSMAENAKFYRVCEYLYEKKQKYDRVLLCYLNDSIRKPQCFSFIRQTMLSYECSPEEKSKFQDVVLENFQQLIHIDSKEASEMILELFPDRIKEVCAILEDDQSLLYKFLQGIFSFREPGNGTIMSAKEQTSQDPFLQEKYIELMCQFDPAQVYSYLCMADGFRLEETLEICRRYQITDSIAFLLEKTGDIHGAFEILIETLQKRVHDVEELLLKGKQKADLSITWHSLQTILLKLIQLCQSHSSKMDATEREALWFSLVEVMLAVQQKIRGKVRSEYLDAFKELTNHLLSSMVGYVALPSILQRIMEDPAYNTGKLGEIRELFMGMLETYNYEKMLLFITNSLLNSDLHSQLVQLKNVSSRAFASHYLICSICKKEYTSADFDILVFRCGHSSHHACLEKLQSTSQASAGSQEKWACTICIQNTKKQQATSSRFLGQKVGEHSMGFQQFGNGIRSGITRRITLDGQQLEALATLRRYQRSPSRLAAFNDLRKASSSMQRMHSLFSQEELQLHLSPKYLDNYENEF